MNKATPNSNAGVMDFQTGGKAGPEDTARVSYRSYYKRVKKCRRRPSCQSFRGLEETSFGAQRKGSLVRQKRGKSQDDFEFFIGSNGLGGGGKLNKLAPEN